MLAGMVVLAALAGCGTQATSRVPAPAAQRLLGAGIAFDPGSGVIAFGGQQRTAQQVKPSAAMWRWTGGRWQPVTVKARPGARTRPLLVSGPRGLLLFGGYWSSWQTTLASCHPQPDSGSGQAACAGSATISPVRALSDTWAFTRGVWKQVAPGGQVPRVGQLLADDPGLGTVVLVGQSLYSSSLSRSGTWRWAGHHWSLLSATSPDGADSLGFDPVSHRLLAYAGMRPSGPNVPPDAPVTLGYSHTWAFTAAGWAQLHPPSPPARAPGVLTMSPDGRRLLLITTLAQTWAWTGRTWRRYRTRGGPPAHDSPWTGTTLSAAADTSRHQIVLLVTSDNANDQTWTLHGHTWTHHPGTP